MGFTYWAKSKGYVKFPNPEGKPEEWGVYNKNKEFKWRLVIKPEAGFREGLASGSRVSRFDARLTDKGSYINPFTGEVGTYRQVSHISLENPYFKSANNLEVPNDIGGYEP